MAAPAQSERTIGRILRPGKAYSGKGGNSWVDVNHLNLSEDLPSAIRRAGNRIGEFHLSDNHGEKEEHLMLGEGTIDWESVAEAIAAINFDGAIVLETNTFDRSEVPSLVVAAGHAVKSFAGRIEGMRLNV